MDKTPPGERAGFGRSLVRLAGFLAVCFAAAGLGSWLTAGAVETWYPTLTKPAGTPPSWVFGLVWTAVYATMAVSGWLVWQATRGPHRARAMVPWGVQLVLTVTWSALFFTMQRPRWALVEIVVLVAAIVWTMTAFRDVDRRAASLLAPYLAWVVYAAALNAAIVWLN